MNKYRIAIIGLGGMGRSHAEAVELEANCELVSGARSILGGAFWR
jgi:predicted dehydrogenase